MSFDSVETVPNPTLVQDNNNNGYINVERKSFKEVIYSCKLCHIRVTNQILLQRHLNGKKHRLKVERHGKSFVCEICEITANSEKQLELHLKSSKHKFKSEKKLRQGSMTLSGSIVIWTILICILFIFIVLLLLFKTIL